MLRYRRIRVRQAQQNKRRGLFFAVSEWHVTCAYDDDRLWFFPRQGFTHTQTYIGKELE